MSFAGSSENDSVRHHEKILRSTHELYVGDEDSVDPSPYSLEGMAKTMGMTVLHPLRKVTVMLIGNHSAGKSSFVNWYTDDVVQKAGMAVETQGFTFVVQGKREMIKAPLKGESTIEMFPHIKGIEEIGGDRIVEHLQTRVSTKRSKSFPLVQFIDTPGMVDGGVTYPFNLEATMLRLADYADLIFCFFDTHGTCTVKRTMDTVKLLNDNKLSFKMKYFLSKADSISNQTDLTKITTQMACSIKDFVDNTHGLEIPAIFLPGVHRDSEHTEVENQIGSLTDTIDAEIQSKVQSNLKRAAQDCKKIDLKIEADMLADLELKRAMKAQQDMGNMLRMVAWVIPSVTFLDFLQWIESALPEAVRGSEWVKASYAFVQPAAKPISDAMPEARWKVYCVLICAFLLVVSLAKFMLGKAGAMKRKSLSVQQLDERTKFRLSCESRLQKCKQYQKDYLDYFKGSEFGDDE